MTSTTPSEKQTAMAMEPEMEPMSEMVSTSETETAPQKRPRKNRWFALVIPAVLGLIFASSHHISLRDLPALGDDVAPEYAPPVDADVTHTPWHHRRQAEAASGSAASASAASSILFPSGSTTATSSSASSTSTTSLQPYQQALPTVPASPPAPPTPFPEPLDTISQDFSTVGCQSFIEGLAQSSALQACVPFSLLLQTSNGFISTQNNLTTLNAVIEASCNPQPSLAQCTSSLLQLASSLQTSCKTDLANDNPQAQGVLAALLAYGPMQAAACTSNPTTNAYCYVTAVHSTNPSDLYFFQLPLGTQLPNNTTPSCSGCTKSVMALYAESAAQGNLSALASTYNHAAAVAESKCGAGYVQQITTSAGSSAAAGRASADARVWVLSSVLASAALLLVSWS